MPVLKNVENKIKLVTFVCILFLVGCIVISIASVFIASNMVKESHKKIYVLDGNVPVLVHQTTIDESFPIEAKADIEYFHHLFFTLTPDDKYIQYTMNKAMYLVDASGQAQYNALKEKGFYNQVIGTSTVCSIFCDSIKLDEKKMEFVYYGRQRIERRTSILFRSLVTSGRIRRIPRSENNPYGLLIYNWKTLKNADLEERQKSVI